MPTAQLLPRLAVPIAALLALGACSPGPTARATSATPERAGSVSIVASTNVYGDIAATLGGDAVTVTSIISDPAADPHSYEASTRTMLALSKADVVIENGGGYDDFVDTMLDASHNDAATVLNAMEVSGNTARQGAELNEHVWYDFGAVRALADKLVVALSKALPAQASTFAANGTAFKAELATLEKTAKVIAAQHAGEGVAITEPVPLYLLQTAGLENKTPGEFAEAVEEGTDVPPAAMQATIDLLTRHEVAALVYNSQVTGPETDRVLDAAKEADVAVVPVTETLPKGERYVPWMTSQLSALHAALAK